MTRISIYDLDETITRRPTFARWLLFWVRTRAPWRLPLLALQGLVTLAYLGGWVDRARLKRMGIAFCMGRAERGAVEAAARAFVARELRGNVLADALAAIASDRAEGRRLVLATASMDFYASAFAEGLGFETAIATKAGWAGARLMPGAPGPNCYGGEKLVRVEAWWATQGVARKGASVRAYSDHISDAPLLDWADAGVAVNPAPVLAKMARAREWLVVRWR